MNLTFSLFGYFFSLQLFKNLFVPIERLDGQANGTSLALGNEHTEAEQMQSVALEPQKRPAMLS